MVYTDDVNILGENINTLKKNRESLLDAGKELGLEANSARKCIWLSLDTRM
jgi:hypothetical protein